MAKRKRKPFDPAVAEARREKAMNAMRAQARADGIDVSVADLDGVEISRERQDELEGKGCTVILNHRRRLISAVAPGHHKADVWWQLHSRGGLSGEQLQAVRDLQDLMARRAGVGGRNEEKAMGDVRIDEPLRDPCLVSDGMLQAGIEMDLTLAMVGPPSSRLLTAMLWPVVLAEPFDWRETVKHITGEKEPHAQAATLRIAAQALVDVKADVQRALKDQCDARREARRSNAERADPQAMALA